MNRLLALRRLAALPLLLIPAVIIGVISQLNTTDSSEALDALPLPPPKADYYLRDAELSSMDANGRLLYRVKAGNVLHFPDQSISLDAVSVDYLDGPWTLTADSGHIPPGEQNLQLKGQVRMQGNLRSGQPVQLDTPEITVAIGNRQIETDATVVVSSPSIRATATGMRADMAGEELELLSNVRVRYEP